MCVTVRPLREADYPEVYRIHQAGLASGNAAYAEEPASWQEFRAQKLLDFCFVAEADGQLLGWATLKPFSANPHMSGLLEDSIYVAPDAAGRGVGELLLRELIRAAREADGRVWAILASIFTENTASRGLHEKCGFRHVGTLSRQGLMSYGPHAGRIRSAEYYELLI